MMLIDVGDLSLEGSQSALHERLFHAIRAKIVAQLWPLGGKLPSTRKLANELSISRNTVIAAYEQLVAEGYLESRKGSGFYVTVHLPDHYLHTSSEIMPQSAAEPISAFEINKPFAPGVPDLAQFPIDKWQRMLLRHGNRISLMGNQNVQGSLALRQALAEYLASSRSVACNASRIIITSGAQQALYIATSAILGVGDKVLMEQPGYAQMSKVLKLKQVDVESLIVKENVGFDLLQVEESAAKALYVTPSNQYPMGTTLNSEQRLNLIHWANLQQRWIIEDDYDSEFQFAHRPYTSLQGLASEMSSEDRVLYVGSFSKVMFNGLRLGYLVVPESLVATCLQIKDATSGDTATHGQEALADFISEGHLLRHIRKMRKLYHQKYQRMCSAIELHFKGKVKVISQAAGLHVTIKWAVEVDEIRLATEAEKIGIVVRPMRYYEDESNPYRHNRAWHSVVLGFGNTGLEQIEPNIAALARLFERLETDA